MARVEIPVTTVTHAGVTYPTATNSNGTLDMEVADNDATIILIMTNVSASTRTIVIEAAASFGSPPIPLEDITITLSATGNAAAKKVAGPFSARLFNQTGDASLQSVLVDVDGAASDVTFVALSVPIAVA